MANTKMFVHFGNTKTQFINDPAGLPTKYYNSIVFIKGDANGDGSCIYTHGTYFANFKEFISAYMAALNYVKGVNVDGTNYNAAAGGGYLAFSASDPSTVAVNAGHSGITIGLTSDFINKVNSTATLADNTSKALGAATDAAKADGSAFARIAKLVESVAALQGEGSGSIEDQITAAIEKLAVDAKAGDYVASISQEDGKIVPVMGTFNFDEAGSAATAEQNAKDYAKSYADGLASNYEVAGAAKTAEDNAKAYADGLASNYDAAGSAAAVEAKLTTHTEDAVAHVTAAERADWNAAKTAIDTFLKDADMTADAVDTLKELQTYMTTDGEAAAELVGRVATLEAIDHDAYKAADTALEKSLKGYVDGKDTAMDTRVKVLEGRDVYVKSDVDSAIADAKKAGTDAAAAVTTLANGAVKTNTEAIKVINGDGAGSIAKAKADAIADAAAKLKAVTDTLKSAAFTEVATLESTMDSKDATNLAAAKTYADDLFAWEEL